MPRLNEHNTVLLSRTNLPSILEYLSERLFASFGCQVHIVAHGGAVMVLHPKLACRSSTRDIDFCLRSFVTEWQKKGFYDAEARLNKCIKATAKHFGLGEDWMNAHADVALPMAADSKGRPYDPIYYDAINPSNIVDNTIYSSRGLLLIGVTWPWAVALKLVRYQKDDPTDIAHILTLGFRSQGIEWTQAIMEDWLKKACSAMGYDWYPREVMEQTRQRMSHAISLALNVAWAAYNTTVTAYAGASAFIPPPPSRSTPPNVSRPPYRDTKPVTSAAPPPHLPPPRMHASAPRMPPLPFLYSIPTVTAHPAASFSTTENIPMMMQPSMPFLAAPVPMHPSTMIPPHNGSSIHTVRPNTTAGRHHHTSSSRRLPHHRSHHHIPVAAPIMLSV